MTFAAYRFPSMADSYAVAMINRLTYHRTAP